MSSLAQSPDTTATSVYYYFDACGVLLYVGVTKTGDGRQRQHGASSPWWPLVVGSSVQHYPSRREALAVEAQVIREQMPPFNRAGNPEAWAGMISYFMSRMARLEPNHEHDPEATYARCRNCGRCAEVEPWAAEFGSDGLCEPCAGLVVEAYEDGLGKTPQSPPSAVDVVFDPACVDFDEILKAFTP